MKSVRTTLEILELISDRQPIGVADIAGSTGLPKSTAQRALVTLADEGWIAPDPSGRAKWVLTMKALTIGSRARGADLRERARPAMEWLLAREGENVHLGVPIDGRATLVEKLESDHAVRTFDRIGQSAPIYAASTGKAVLAFLPEAKIDAVIASGLTRHTAKTLTDPDVLRKELHKIRELGYAVNRGEWREDVRAVGAPIFENGVPVAAISVSAPASRVPARRIPSLAKSVLEAITRIAPSAGRRPEGGG